MNFKEDLKKLNIELTNEAFLNFESIRFINSSMCLL